MNLFESRTLLSFDIYATSDKDSTKNRFHCLTRTKKNNFENIWVGCFRSILLRKLRSVQLIDEGNKCSCSLQLPIYEIGFSIFEHEINVNVSNWNENSNNNFTRYIFGCSKKKKNTREVSRDHSCKQNNRIISGDHSK